MAYNPYFRYETNTLNLRTGMRAPVFPVNAGLGLHTNINLNPIYVTTTRLHGTTIFTYQLKGLKNDDRDIVYDFWSQTLGISQGYSDFTIIDNKGRMLFEASWNNWLERWSKRNGGVFDITINLESSVPWTPPLLGAYLMTDDTVDNHTLQGSNLSLVDGTLEDRISGMVNKELSLVGTSAQEIRTGASGVVNWRTNINGSFSIFCQFRMADISSDLMTIAEMTNESGSINFTLAHTTLFGGNINGEWIQKASGEWHSITPGNWYDCAITYDAHNDNAYIYIADYNSATFTDFMFGGNDTTDYIGTYMSSPRIPSKKGYTKINLLLCNDAGNNFGTSENERLRNAMFFDGHLNPMQFNTLRRLCFQWNNKETAYPK